MSEVSDTAQTDALAAEYVLGTLDADEIAHAQTLLAEDPEFSVKVKRWERRLGELHLMVEPVEPDPRIWERVRSKMPSVRPIPPPEPAIATVGLPETAAVEPSPAGVPEAASSPAPVVESTAAGPIAAVSPNEVPRADASSESGTAAAPDTVALVVPPAQPEPGPQVAQPPESTAPVPSQAGQEGGAPQIPTAATVSESVAPSEPEPVKIPPIPPAPHRGAPVQPDRALVTSRRRAGFWRGLAMLLILLVLALAGLLAAWRIAPERVPPALQPVELLRLIGVKLPTAPAPVPAAPQRPPAPPESQFDE